MATPKYSVFDIAHYFIRKAHESGSFISNLQLQKLTYYSYAWHLALNEGRPLFVGPYEAWVHGPVHVELYKKYKKYAWRNIDESVTCREFDADTKKFLEEIAGVFMKYDGFQLEQMTHAEKPWIEARGDLPPDEPSNEPLRDQTIIDFYKTLAS